MGLSNDGVGIAVVVVVLVLREVVIVIRGNTTERGLGAKLEDLVVLIAEERRGSSTRGSRFKRLGA